MLKRINPLQCFGAAMLVCGVAYLPTRLTIAKQQAPYPQLIFMLGGGQEREVLTAQFSQRHPDLSVWVSAGEANAAHIFRGAQVSDDRIYLDERASDTVTNFTTVVEDFQHLGVQHIYLVTSDVHMPRARAIATVVFGSHGITFTPVSLPSQGRSESRWRIVRDVGRSMVWLVTGRTGASLKRRSLTE